MQILKALLVPNLAARHCVCLANKSLSSSAAGWGVVSGGKANRALNVHEKASMFKQKTTKRH